MIRRPLGEAASNSVIDQAEMVGDALKGSERHAAASVLEDGQRGR
jgi:hypothetical protein